ncbi:hypothetical protein PTRA_a1386 [Pseudoalteromonas translucida KMM 520]|uniref:Uncharacterized protein n=1 Tax=Pseudoalteromonas translucida KMM 520 TaxID=1315283 RepID=A0A0U2ISD9_9GAMM|nr:hypothetical protein PTRA_a1386 [Pseudoalteromonas translucida KMM 520]
MRLVICNTLLLSFCTLAAITYATYMRPQVTFNNLNDLVANLLKLV